MGQTDIKTVSPHKQFAEVIPVITYQNFLEGLIALSFKQYFSYIQLKSKGQGPVVQSVVSLTSSLRVISLTVLADSIYNNLIFFAEKCE